METLIEIIKWPIVCIISVLILKRPLSEMINGITDFSLGGKNGLSARIQRNKTKEKDEEFLLKKEEPPSKIKYIKIEKSGKVVFDYSNNNGVYTIGENEYKFDTMWTKASKEYIHFYNDKPSIKTVRLAKDVQDIDSVDPNKYDSSSRARTAGIGQFAIFENTQGNFLIAKILDIKDDSRGDKNDELTFEYKILALEKGQFEQ